MTNEHPIQGLMRTAMESITHMIDVNTILGDPIETPDGSVILTVSKVGFGFGAGGTQFYFSKQEEERQEGKREGLPHEGKALNGQFPFGGGSGGGVSITPVAFLIVQTSGVRVIHLNGETHLYDKMLDFAPQVLEKIQQMFKKKEAEWKSQCKEEQDTKMDNEDHFTREPYMD